MPQQVLRKINGMEGLIKNTEGGNKKQTALSKEFILN